MLTVQDVGTQILGNTPGKFYIFGGSEYGIKEKYIQILSEYHGDLIEAQSVLDVLSMMSKKHIVPLNPAVYVIRYDEGFVSSISDATEDKISTTNIVGTIVCIYESSKHMTKLSKYLPKYTVSIDAVSPQFVSKYLHSDFPKLADNCIEIAVKYSDNYSKAKNMCRCMNNVPAEKLLAMSDDQISKLFGCVDMSTEIQIRQGVASRNFKYLIDVVSNYEDQSDRIVYAVLQTMIELDKVLANSRIQSDVKQYANLWTQEDIYYMFMHAYDELYKLRSTSSYDVQNSLIYLFGLLKFQRIPGLEVMNR